MTTNAYGQRPRPPPAVPVAAPSAGGSKYGAFSSRPAAGTSGNLFVAKDAPVALWADDGSVWHPLVGGQIVGTQPKVAASFSSVNPGSSTLTDRNGALFYNGNGQTGSTNARLYVESLSSNTAHVEAAFTHTRAFGGFTSADATAQVILRESSSGKFFGAGPDMHNPGSGEWVQVIANYWSTATARTSSNGYMLQKTNSPLFFRVSRDLTNVYAQISTDAQNWFTYQTTALSSVFTTAPDQAGIAGVTIQSSDVLDFTVLHYLSGT